LAESGDIDGRSSEIEVCYCEGETVNELCMWWLWMLPCIYVFVSWCMF